MAGMGPVVVVGGGISGVACARTLADAGVDVELLDRGHRLGGRMAARSVQGRVVDTGASYFTVGDDAFAAVVEDWATRGLARPWTDTFEVVEDGRWAGPKQGADRWSAPGGLRSLVEDLARGLQVRRHTVGSVVPAGPGHPGVRLLVDDRPAAAVVLAMPDPQARRLLDPALEAAREALDDPFAPVLALSAGWERRHWAPDLHGAFVNGDDVLTWVADDGSRRGDGSAVLVAHSGAAFAGRHLQVPEAAEEPMTQALMRVMGIAHPPAWTHLHRWTFAHPAGTRERTHHLDDDGVGLCGDAWSARPRVEGAYLSGAALGSALVGRLAG
jgi:renalase